MPGLDGRLTDEEVGRVRQRLKDARNRDPMLPPTHRCPYCGASDWTMGAHIVVDDIPSETSGPQPIVPYVAFFCRNCTYTMRFNAAMIGLFDEPTSTAPPPPEEPHV